MKKLFFFCAAILFFSQLSFAAKEGPFEADFQELPKELLSRESAGTMSELKNKIVVVDFWASWCGPCKESLPHYNKIAKKYKDQGVVFIGINEDEDLKEREAYLNKHSAEFPQYADTGRMMAKAFNVQAIPTLFVFGKNLKPAMYFRGFKSERPKQLETLIQQLLK